MAGERGIRTSAPTWARAREMRANFAHIYAADPKRNGAEAARQAGYLSVATKGLARIASRLLLLPDVVAIVEKETLDRAERLRINADWLLLKLVAEAEADVKDLYDPEGNILPVHDWPPVWRQGLVAGFDVTELYEGTGKDRKHVGRMRKVKLADRTRIKELIGRHISIGAFKDKVEHSVDSDLASLIARSMDIKE